MSQRCTCQRVELQTPEGKAIEGVMVPNDRCAIHGWPDDDWRAGHPLRRHMKLVDEDYGDAVTIDQARARLGLRRGQYLGYRFDRRFREETPRETEARLLREANGTPPPILEIAGLA